MQIHSFAIKHDWHDILADAVAHVPKLFHAGNNNSKLSCQNGDQNHFLHPDFMYCAMK